MPRAPLLVPWCRGKLPPSFVANCRPKPPQATQVLKASLFLPGVKRFSLLAVDEPDAVEPLFRRPRPTLDLHSRRRKAISGFGEQRVRPRSLVVVQRRRLYRPCEGACLPSHFTRRRRSRSMPTSVLARLLTCDMRPPKLPGSRARWSTTAVSFVVTRQQGRGSSLSVRCSRRRRRRRRLRLALGVRGSFIPLIRPRSAALMVARRRGPEQACQRASGPHTRTEMRLTGMRLLSRSRQKDCCIYD